MSELAFLKVPLIAIPYKFATDNHQLENALDYEKKGSCWILKEEEFNQDKLTTLLLNIIQNKEDYLKKIRVLSKKIMNENIDKPKEKIKEKIYSRLEYKGWEKELIFEEINNLVN